MTLHFQREVEKLKKMLLSEAAFVEVPLHASSGPGVLSRAGVLSFPGGVR